MDIAWYLYYKILSFFNNPQFLQSFFDNRFYLILLVVVLMRFKYTTYRSMWMSALVNIPGTFLHELMHFLVGAESDISGLCGEKKAVGESSSECAEPAENSAPAEPKQTVKKPSKQITLQRKEVTQLIGDELSNEEISKYFYFCLQRRDILEEWHKMYTEGKTDGTYA